MLKAKLLAMCVCPALLTPPAILAVHRPARHAVAHLLHRAAERLDQSPPTAVAAVDCLPVMAGGAGPGGVPIGDAGLPGAAIAPAGVPGLFPATYADSPGGGFIGGGSGPGGFGGGGGGGPGSGVPGTSGGSPGTGAISGPPGGGTVVAGPVTPPLLVTPGVPIASGNAPSSAPEPAAWLLMVAGFGAVGIAARTRGHASAVPAAAFAPAAG